MRPDPQTHVLLNDRDSAATCRTWCRTFETLRRDRLRDRHAKKRRNAVGPNRPNLIEQQRPTRGRHRKVCLLSHRTVPNGAGDHRAARTPPWQRAVRWSLPTRHPPTHNGLYGPGFIRLMTPGDTLPPPSRHLEPPFPGGEVGRLNPYHGEDFTMRFTARPRMGGRHAAGMVSWWSSSCPTP